MNKIKKNTRVEDDVWVVLEKIHGSNFSFTTDGTQVIPASRTMFLDEDARKKFFDCNVVVEEMSPLILEYGNCVILLNL